MKEWMRNKIAVIMAILLGGIVADLMGQVSVDPPDPEIGTEVTILLDDPSDQLIITYRPNSSLIRRDTLSSPSPSTTFLWTPNYAGVVQIHTGASTQNISVRYAGVSWKGILVMLIAGVLLLGWATFSMIALFRRKDHGEDTLDLEHLPDT